MVVLLQGGIYGYRYLCVLHVLQGTFPWGGCGRPGTLGGYILPVTGYTTVPYRVLPQHPGTLPGVVVYLQVGAPNRG